MRLAERIQLILQLPNIWNDQNEEWLATKNAAYVANAWFTKEYIDLSIANINQQFLQETALNNWIQQYPKLIENYPHNAGKSIGIVMAGNIPLVGFHDFLAAFLGGFNVHIKLSSKDTVLWQFLHRTLTAIQPDFANIVHFLPMLKACDAYIATGSNNSARYFEQYFSKYPNIIRKNRTSIAVLNGEESDEELHQLAHSMHTYFGLGCRNISKIYVPQGYNFERFIQQTKMFEWQRDHNKYKNNYDFQLAMYILNKVIYMSNEAMLFVENKEYYAPVSVVHYEYYTDINSIVNDLNASEQLQCIEVAPTLLESIQAKTSVPVIAMGNSQAPSLTNYADHIDTMAFLSNL